jgi:hypothetical protein
VFDEKKMKDPGGKNGNGSRNGKRSVLHMPLFFTAL